MESCGSTHNMGDKKLGVDIIHSMNAIELFPIKEKAVNLNGKKSLTWYSMLLLKIRCDMKKEWTY